MHKSLDAREAICGRFRPFELPGVGVGGLAAGLYCRLTDIYI